MRSCFFKRLFASLMLCGFLASAISTVGCGYDKSTSANYNGNGNGNNNDNRNGNGNNY